MHVVSPALGGRQRAGEREREREREREESTVPMGRGKGERAPCQCCAYIQQRCWHSNHPVAHVPVQWRNVGQPTCQVLVEFVLGGGDEPAVRCDRMHGAVRIGGGDEPAMRCDRMYGAVKVGGGDEPATWCDRMYGAVRVHAAAVDGRVVKTLACTHRSG
jgi:hypothetical protein